MTTTHPPTHNSAMVIIVSEMGGLNVKQPNNITSLLFSPHQAGRSMSIEMDETRLLGNSPHHEEDYGDVISLDSDDVLYIDIPPDSPLPSPLPPQHEHKPNPIPPS